MENGLTVVAIKLGDLKSEVTQVSGSNFNVTLKDVKYVPEFWVKFLALTNHSKMDSS
jgi:hypothetical protein